MPVNGLTRAVSLHVGPVMLGTLFRHFLARAKGEESLGEDEGRIDLRKGELMYDQMFNVIKAFLKAASLHTIEEVQGFANTRVPAPPWVRVVRLVVPRSCCDEAALYIIKAFGGEENTKRIVGGVKWWQVRGINGVDSQWVTAKKDWREAKKRDKLKEEVVFDNIVEETACYDRDMDEMRCILYLHGGGYYFGSVDQQRYSYQRHARKINGRVFAINYRLAPQYPFPCALQDALAAYLYLIKPPPEAAHQAVKPAHIVIAGDSAGGGLAIALFQILRDTSLPMPAGGVLISPWCDLTHSFPSVHTNTATDVIPEYGLSMQKPSTLWPPPSEEVTRNFHTSIRDRIRRVIPSEALGESSKPAVIPEKTKEMHSSDSAHNLPIDVGATTDPVDTGPMDCQTIELKAEDGEILKIQSQVHMYTPNNLLEHPLISPVLSYLGGLPPLLVIVGDGEVLRDEGIYFAHRAANPGKYLIREGAKRLYPSLQDIEGRYAPTPVHLQVYDGAAHDLPVLFSFTTPAKYCYRTVATFCKRVTGMSSPIPSPGLPSPRSPNAFPRSPTLSPLASPSAPAKPKRSVSLSVVKMMRGLGSSASLDLQKKDPLTPGTPITEQIQVVDGASLGQVVYQEPENIEEHRTAGEPSVYETSMFPFMNSSMIRERVSGHGVIRPLEAEDELPALQVPEDRVGRVAELAMRRYCAGKSRFDKKFAGALKTIEKHRMRNMKMARKDTLRNIAKLLTHDVEENQSKTKAVGSTKDDELVLTRGSWSWASVIGCDERPPPSSIVSRRDTDEARSLAKVADEAAGGGSMSGNNLWSTMVDVLTGSNARIKNLETNEKGEESMDGWAKLKVKWFGSERPAAEKTEMSISAPTAEVVDSVVA